VDRLTCTASLILYRLVTTKSVLYHARSYTVRSLLVVNRTLMSTVVPSRIVVILVLSHFRETVCCYSDSGFTL